MAVERPNGNVTSYRRRATFLDGVAEYLAL